MLAYTREKLKYLLKLDFIRFCIVGGLGFTINLIILVGLSKLFGMPIFIAQLIGAEVALFNNFVLHHKWTYKKHNVKKNVGTLLVQFHATTWPAILGSTVMVTVGVQTLHFNKLLALLASSLIALMWNFGWSKFVVWRDVSKQDIEKLAHE